MLVCAATVQSVRSRLYTMGRSAGGWPRMDGGIRNWKNLHFFRPDPEVLYKHIDLFLPIRLTGDLIETMLPEMLRVALSIGAGARTSSISHFANSGVWSGRRFSSTTYRRRASADNSDDRDEQK